MKKSAVLLLLSVFIMACDAPQTIPRNDSSPTTPKTPTDPGLERENLEKEIETARDLDDLAGIDSTKISEMNLTPQFRNKKIGIINRDVRSKGLLLSLKELLVFEKELNDSKQWSGLDPAYVVELKQKVKSDVDLKIRLTKGEYHYRLSKAETNSDFYSIRHDIRDSDLPEAEKKGLIVKVEGFWIDMFRREYAGKIEPGDRCNLDEIRTAVKFLQGFGFVGGLSSDFTSGHPECGSEIGEIDKLIAMYLPEL